MFICFEGIDGAGKTTQAEWLRDELVRAGYNPVLRPRDPGHTPAGTRIRELLLDKNLELSPHAQHLLFAAARCELAKVIQQTLRQPKGVVIVDRWLPSTFAYQGTQGIDYSFIAAVYGATCHWLKPDVTFILDLPVQAARHRLHDKAPDRFESFDEAQVELRRYEYLRVCSRLQWRHHVLDAMQPSGEVALTVMQWLREDFDCNFKGDAA